MNRIRSFSQFVARDTDSRQIAAEQEWVRTCWQPTTQAPIRQSAQTRTMPRRIYRVMAIIGCAVLGSMALAGLAVAVYGFAVLLAAMVAP